MESTGSWKQVLSSWNFLLSALIVGAAVTWMFYTNGDGIGITTQDGLLYWSVYFICLVFLLFVIVVLVKRQQHAAPNKASQ